MNLTRHRISVPACCLSMLALALGLSACAGKTTLATSDGGPDARVRTRPYDECGNGMDDDGDGQIDEDCFCGGGETQPCFTGVYPNRGVGACADGVQTCDAVGSTEFGHWGACTMDTRPAHEACDGIDNDCDGAIDEDCPCTAGQTQGCGSEFAVAPCSTGTQTCRADGTWSSCEGAIGPSAEACGDGAGDGIDNDCDGMTDEGCTCVPQPEVCRDGVDNDCDGTVDEPACTLASGLDGGEDSTVPGCTPTAELCGDGLDNDCDGLTDEDCMCGPITLGLAQTITYERAYTLDRANLAAVWNPAASELGVARMRQDTSTSPMELELLRFGADATLHGQSALARTGGSIGGLAWTGSNWVAVWTSAGHVFAARAAADGSPVGETVTISTAASRPAENAKVLSVGHDLYIAWSESLLDDSDIHMAHYTAELVPVTADLRLGPGRGWIDLAWGGDALGVLDVSSRPTVYSTTARFSLVRDDTLVAQSELVISAASSDLLVPALAFGGGGYLACWPGSSSPRTPVPVRCVRVSAGGDFVPGSGFDNDVPTTTTGDLGWNGCSFVLYALQGDVLPGPVESYVSEIGTRGSVVSTHTLPWSHSFLSSSPIETFVVPGAGREQLMLLYGRGSSDVIDIQHVE